MNAVVYRAMADELMKIAEAQKLTVYTSVPPKAVKAILREGLLSGHELAKRPDLLALARPDKKVRAEWLDRYNQKGADPWHRVPYNGPNVFFGQPDPKKITQEHYINKRKLVPLEIDLGQLLKDHPKTRIQGFELKPYQADGHNVSRRGRLSVERVRRYTETAPEELWKDYSDARYYAANVPHAAIVVPGGRIEPKYIRRQEKR